MQRSLRIFFTVVLSLTLSVFAASLAMAAPQPQATASSIDLSNGFAFAIFHGGVKVGTWTVASDGSWVTTDTSDAPISSGTLNWSTSTASRSGVMRVDFDVIQESPAAGTAHLTLFFVGGSKFQLVGGGMSAAPDGGDSVYSVVFGAVFPNSAMLSVSQLLPVMFTGAPVP